MDKQLFKNIAETFGTEPVSGEQIYAKILLHPDNSIAVYYINADSIKGELMRRSYRWEPLLKAWVKKVDSIPEAKAETRGYPSTAGALGH
jgi:hypothetical protein